MRKVQAWFAQHVTLDGKPYTLDFDQARAVADNHKNTLVTARAGSGKTRVIVAKVAYLVGAGFARLDQIATFMFNRTAAAEVNQRLATVEIDGRSLLELAKVNTITIAATFHKFALDIIKQYSEKPQIINEAEQQSLVSQSLNIALEKLPQKLSPKAYQELLGIVSNFITRAGQKYPGVTGLAKLQQEVTNYCQAHQQIPEYQAKIRYHQIASQAYAAYVKALSKPKIDFNLLLGHATIVLQQATFQPQTYRNLRQLAPTAKLFAVGDDWQAINRFAGSDVDYFINFSNYFPEDNINIPLATNYRSCRRIVEHANQYMLTHYDPQAIPAKAQNHQAGKIRYIKPSRTKLDASDLQEDGMGDGRFLATLCRLLHDTNHVKPNNKTIAAARLLKTLVKIIQRHPFSEIMLLHRHNFTSHDGVTLEVLVAALRDILEQEGIIDPANFDRQIRCLTMHRSKGLEAEVVVLLEANAEIVNGVHPHATIFELFGDNLAAERADQSRLLYVALTRAKKYLYILSDDDKPPL